MHITKKGNKQLRCCISGCNVFYKRLKRDDNSIKDFYIKKKQQSKPDVFESCKDCMCQ